MTMDELKKYGTINTKTDCVIYDKDSKRCKGLSKLYCRNEVCNFYKSDKEYDKVTYRRLK